MRAADDGWATHFSAFLVASSLFRFDSESQLQPIAANADRWSKLSFLISYQSWLFRNGNRYNITFYPIPIRIHPFRPEAMLTCG